MNGTFFALAFSTVLNPKLFAIDLILIANRRPRMMFACFLIGGIGLNVTIGLLDVLVFQADAVSSQGSVSAAVQLGLGLVLLAAAALIATGRPRRRQKASAPSGAAEPEQRESWADRNLREPRPWLAVGLGALAGTPGAAYITALHHLVNGHYSTATQVAAVLVFNLIQWSPVILPFVFLETRPEATKRALQGVIDWLTSHARTIGATLALAVGAYLTIEGLARLLP
jgi:hypothetical protein